MPIYEYQCTGCGHEFTAIRRITDETLPECPECHKGPVQKKISLSAFHLKGSGWYKTDYAKSGSSGNGKPHKKATESSTEGSSSSESKPAESKPASSDKPPSP
jgi:putative FmdB family regulatory protein